MKYIGFFDTELNLNENRNYHMSSKNKMFYVAKTISELKLNVEIISPSWTKNKRFYKGKKIGLDKGISLRLGPTIPYSKIISKVWSILWLFFILIKNTRKNETIVVYHSLPLMLPIILLKKIKKNNVILEVEEIYSDVWEEKRKFSIIENIFIKNMDHRILVSEKLKDSIGQDNDIVLYGSYYNKRNENISRIRNSLVYAGSIEKTRGGAFTAIETMRYMTKDDVTLYILGTGDIDTVKNMKELINEINTIRKNESIIFLGEKNGEEFERIMNKFQFGLNLQYKGKYMDSAFPSKILTYLSFNHNVISSEIPSITNSPFVENIFFTKGDKPKDLANEICAIIDLDIVGEDTSFLIDKFHNQFKEELKSLLQI